MRFQKVINSRAFTLIELLVVILVVGILIAVAAPSFLGQQDKAHDSAVKQNLAVAYRAGKPVWVEQNAYLPAGSLPSASSDTNTLIGALQKSEPQMRFVDAATGVSATDDRQVQVIRVNADIVTYAATSKSGRTYCVQSIERAQTVNSIPVKAGLYYSWGYGPDACGSTSDGGTPPDNTGAPIGPTNPPNPANPAVPCDSGCPLPAPPPPLTGAPPAPGTTQVAPNTSVPAFTDEQSTSVTKHIFRGSSFWGNTGGTHSQNCTTDCETLWAMERSATNTTASEYTLSTATSGTSNPDVELNSELLRMRVAVGVTANMCSGYTRYPINASGLLVVRFINPGTGGQDRIMTFETMQPLPKSGGSESDFNIVCWPKGGTYANNLVLAQDSFVFSYKYGGQTWRGINFSMPACQYTNPPVNAFTQTTNTASGWCVTPATVSGYWLPRYLAQARPMEPYTGQSIDATVQATYYHPDGSNDSTTKNAILAQLATGQYPTLNAMYNYWLGVPGAGNPIMGS